MRVAPLEHAPLAAFLPTLLALLLALGVTNSALHGYYLLRPLVCVNPNLAVIDIRIASGCQCVPALIAARFPRRVDEQRIATVRACGYIVVIIIYRPVCRMIPLGRHGLALPMITQLFIQSDALAFAAERQGVDYLMVLALKFVSAGAMRVIQDDDLAVRRCHAQLV
jgi:hypothetical protein